MWFGIKNWCLKNLLSIACGLIAISVIITAYLLIKTAIYGYTVGAGEIDFAVTGQVGDFVGGFVGTIISTAGFIFLCLTLVEQRKAFSQERFESNFFEHLRINKDNINELLLRDPIQGKTISSGRRVFKFIYHQINASYYLIDIIFDGFKSTDILSVNTLNQLNSNFKHRKFSAMEFAKINIAYSIVFFGVGSDSLNTIKGLLYKEYKKDFIDAVFYFFSLIPHRSLKKDYEKWTEVSKDKGFIKELLKSLVVEKNDSKKIIERFKSYVQGNSLNALISQRISQQKYFGGHQSKLGHYFRHLYQTVKFIDKQRFSYQDKYEYAKTLRSQLTNYEQHLLFINSLSFMGRAWELDLDRTEYDPNKWLITKYNLIKNIPDTKLFNQINTVDYYPDIDFEFELPSTSRIAIQKYFR